MEGASEMETVRVGTIYAEPYHYPHDDSFDPWTTALVIIDMQRDCEGNSHLSRDSSLIGAQSAKKVATLTVRATMFMRLVL